MFKLYQNLLNEHIFTINKIQDGFTMELDKAGKKSNPGPTRATQPVHSCCVMVLPAVMRLRF